MSVQDLDWSKDEDIERAGGPYKFVLAADCVYHEEHVFNLRRTIVALTDLKSTGGTSSATCRTQYTCPSLKRSLQKLKLSVHINRICLLLAISVTSKFLKSLQRVDYVLSKALASAYSQELLMVSFLHAQ